MIGRILTDKEAKHIYNTKGWKKVRRDVLKRDNWQCQDCIKRLKQAETDGVALTGKDAKIRRASHVHHIQELKLYPELAYNMNNLISLCETCHNIRHGRVMTKYGPRIAKKKATQEMW